MEIQIGNLWNALSEEEKYEVLLAYHESEEDENLIEASEIFKSLIR